MQNFGFAGLNNVIYIGTNGKMTEICVATGLVNLEHLDEFLDVNKRNYDAYKADIAKVEGLKLIEFNKAEKCNWRRCSSFVPLDQFCSGRACSTLRQGKLCNYIETNLVKTLLAETMNKPQLAVYSGGSR